jgi:hypothetical protein
VSDIWYYADERGQIGPLTLQQLRETLATLSNAKDVLVWCDGFPDWKRAGDVSELRAQTVVPPPLPAKGLGVPIVRKDKDTTDSPDPTRPAPEPKGIDGWLIFPAIGTILSPFYVGYSAVQNSEALKILKNSSPSKLQTFGSIEYASIELVFNFCLLIAWVVAIFYLFRRKRLYPRLFVTLCAIIFIGNLCEILIERNYFNYPAEPNDIKAILQPLLALIIWGPYMQISRRVRNTFVND